MKEKVWLRNRQNLVKGCKQSLSYIFKGLQNELFDRFKNVGFAIAKYVKNQNLLDKKTTAVISTGLPIHHKKVM